MEESPKLLEKLKRAVADSDPTAVMQAAHGLKGELRYLGAENACEVAKQLETFGRDRDPSSAAEMLRLLERELTELQFSIKHFGGELSVIPNNEADCSTAAEPKTTSVDDVLIADAVVQRREIG